MIPFESSEIEGSIGGRFRSVARRVPDNPAIRTSEAAVSYSDLDAASDRIARLLLERRGDAAEPVALLAEEGIEGWAALLGILKAGKSVVLLSPDFRGPRLTAIWEDAGRPPILTVRSRRPLAESLAGPSAPILDLDESAPESGGPPFPRSDPDALAVISYTTGSTGEPKGVMWSHRLVLHTSRYNHERYRLSPADRFAFLSAYGFSAALIQSFAALLSGMTLCLLPSRLNDPASLADWLRREGVTILHLTSFGMFRRPASAPAQRADPCALRTVLLSGEVLYREDLERFRAYFPAGMDFSYRLAGSEALMMTEQPIPADFAFPEDQVPAGFVVPDKELLILGPEGNPVPPGETNEIAIRSRYLADGYWGREELTRSKFLPDPEQGGRRIFLSGDTGRLLPDGALLYVGRKDNVVRVRGFNIQLEAVESALHSIPGIREAAAAALDLRDGEKRLAAYLVAGPGARPSIREIRNHMMSLLPAYMIPTVYVFLDGLPLNPMGRPDRESLPPPGKGRPNLETPLVEPRDDLERRLCELWCGLLELDRIGVEDDFFLLGGDSLMSVTMVLQAEEKFGQEVPAYFFSEPTVAHLARIWRGEEESITEQPSGADAVPARTERRRGRTPRRRKVRVRERYTKHSTPVGPSILPIPGRILRVAAESTAMRLRYGPGCRFLAAWCRRRSVIRWLYSAEAGLFRRWMESLGGCPDAPPEALSICVFGNILWSWRMKRSVLHGFEGTFLESLRRARSILFRDLAKLIDAAPEERFQRFFPVDGLEHLERALQGERGVILVTYHGVANRFAVAALPRRLDGRPIPTLGLSQALRMRRRSGLPKRKLNEAAMLATVAVEGQRRLEQGGILQVIPDTGYDAADGLPLDIGGYRFLVKPGFAELADLSGAAVIPFYSTRRMDGSVFSRFFPPMERLPEHADRKRRVHALLDQYAEFVGRSWKAAPESLLWLVIDAHMNRPPEGG